MLAIHESYLQALLTTALRDGVVTTTEEHDIDEVAKILNISPTRYAELRKGVQSRNIATQGAPTEQNSSKVAGKSVCFTGELSSTSKGAPITRTRAEEIAKDAGMLICKGVTKKLDYLVVSDPNSMSGKANKAREYGTRIIAEPIFWGMVGFGVD